MIKIFGQTDTEYSSNGDKILQPTKCRIHQRDNGEYYAEIECSSQYADYIKNGNIVICPTPTGDQPFRFLNPEINKTKIKVKAKHRYYDSENYLIQDSYVVDKNCSQALEHLNAATDNTSPFTTVSDVASINSFRCVRKSLSEAVNVVLERWGGHLVRDNNIIEIRSSIGADNGVTIRYGKNLKEIQKTEDWNNVVTKLLPVGKDGLLLDELYLYSDTQYALPYTKTITFEQDIEQAEGETDAAYTLRLKDDLRQQATAYLTENCVPKINYTVKANIEKITDIGDTIDVIDETLGINLTTHVIAFEYDAILEKFSQVEFGNSKEKLSNLMSTVAENTSKQINIQQQELYEKVKSDISSAVNGIYYFLQNSNCIYEGDTIYVVDRLPKESAIYVMRISSSGIGFSHSGINGPFSELIDLQGKINSYAENVIFVGSQLLYDKYSFTSSGDVKLTCASYFKLIDAIFDTLTIPARYEKAYRLTAQISSSDGNYIGSRIGKITCLGRTPTDQRQTISSRIVKQSELELESISSNEQGLNLYVSNSHGAGDIYSITIQCLLVDSSLSFDNSWGKVKDSSWNAIKSYTWGDILNGNLH